MVTTEGVGLGNVNIVEQTDYDPFGKITRHEQSGDFAERHKFTSHEFDQSSGYTYAKARYLNTDVGRFLSQDPSFVENPNRFLEDPQQQNSYSYARNNPIVFVDPTGEAAYAIAKGLEANSLGTHVAIVLKPDNISDFANQNIPIQEGGYWIIGSYADDSGSVLIKAMNAQSDSDAYKSGAVKSMEEIKRPEGVSDTEFISKIQNSYNNYTEDAQYDPFATKGYSSNNLATSWMLDAGAELPFGGNAPGIDPGYGSPLPKNYVKSSGVSYVPKTMRQAVSKLGQYGANYTGQQTSKALQRMSNAVKVIGEGILERFLPR